MLICPDDERSDRRSLGSRENLASERQEVLLRMEEAGTGIYELSEEELTDIEEGLREIERGEVATEEEVAALFSRIRR